MEKRPLILVVDDEEPIRKLLRANLSVDGYGVVAAANGKQTIEIIEELGKSAVEILKTLGYEKVKVKIGDGYLGWPDHAPFDAIIVTAAPNEIPPPLIEQLKPGGRMVIPTGSQWEIQHLILLEKKKDGSIEKRSIMPVRFVPFTRKKPEDPKN